MDRITEQNIGMKAKDKITGFTGWITAYVHYLEETPRVRLEADVAKPNGEALEHWAPIGRVEIVPT